MNTPGINTEAFQVLAESDEVPRTAANGDAVKSAAIVVSTSSLVNYASDLLHDSQEGDLPSMTKSQHNLSSLFHHQYQDDVNRDVKMTSSSLCLSTTNHRTRSLTSPPKSPPSSGNYLKRGQGGFVTSSISEKSNRTEHIVWL